MWHWSCRCVYMHVCMSVVSVHTHMCAWAHVYIHMCMHMCMRVYVCVPACVHKCVCACMCVCSKRLGEVSQPWEALCMSGKQDLHMEPCSLLPRLPKKFQP